MRPLIAARAVILRHKSRHALHKRRRDQHEKCHHLLGHAHPRGGTDTQPVHDRQNDHKGKPHQKILQRNGESQSNDLAHILFFKSDLFSGKRKGQRLFPDQNKRNAHTHKLCKHCSNGRACRPHMKTGHQQKIAENIADTGNGHRHQRCPGIPDAAKHTADQIISNDHNGTGPADADICHRPGKCFLRRIHHSGNPASCQRQQHRQAYADHKKQQNTVANDVTALMRLPLSQRLSEKNRRSHGKTHQQIRQRCHNLRTRSHRGHIHRRTKLSHHQQIHRAVHRLQKQRSQHRRHKSQQRFHNISFCKITGHPSFPPVKNGLNKRKRNAFHLIQPVILL